MTLPYFALIIVTFTFSYKNNSARYTLLTFTYNILLGQDGFQMLSLPVDTVGPTNQPTTLLGLLSLMGGKRASIIQRDIWEIRERKKKQMRKYCIIQLFCVLKGQFWCTFYTNTF